jgi:hypothetical protein
MHSCQLANLNQTSQPQTIVRTLFNAEPANDEGAGYFKWKPNWGEMQDFDASANGYLYTRVDTTYQFTTNAVRHYIIITSTRKKVKMASG